MKASTVTHPETGERMYHYAWTSWMWCDREKAVAGDFDEVQDAGECPECGDSL